MHRPILVKFLGLQGAIRLPDGGQFGAQHTFAATSDVASTGKHKADIADAQASDTHIVKDRIDTVVDFKSKALDPNYVSQPGPNPLEHTQGDYYGVF
ncbi:hypothetical protein ABBQ32_007057 [Trebouxia sp. C0010 RCD-2024]